MKNHPRLKPTFLPILVGATRGFKHNKDNWVDINKVVKTIKSLRNMSRGNDLIIEHFNRVRYTKAIYVLSHLSHCFVIYHDVPNNQAYISDGSNFYTNNSVVKDYIDKSVNIKLNPIEYIGQNTVDECASSAIIIALKFMNSSASGIIPSKIQGFSKLKQRFKRKFHQHKSQVVEKRSAITEGSLECEKCGKRFRFSSKQEKSFNLHKRNCSK